MVLLQEFLSSTGEIKVLLKQIHKALVNNNVFGEVAKEIFVPLDGEKDLGDKLHRGIKAAYDKDPENKAKQVHLFEHPGFVLKDGIYGAAFGEFQYVYRCKGIRIHWFETVISIIIQFIRQLMNMGFRIKLKKWMAGTYLMRKR